MAGSKYTIQLGIEGVQQAVAGINKVRSAQMARAQTRQAERQYANMMAAERKAAEEALPAKQRLKNLDAERLKNAKRLEEAQRKLQSREARGVASPFLKHRVAVLKVANKEVDKQIRKVRQLQREQSVGGRMRGAIGRTARGAAGSIAAGLGLYGLGSSARGAISDAGKLQRQSGTIGVDSEFLQEFQYGAEQSGLKADQAAMGLQRFARRLAQAQQGNGELLPQLEKMGISLTDAAGKTKSTEEVLAEYADGITKIQEPQAKLLAGFKAFDSEGAALVQVLGNGAAGLEEFKRQAQESGAVMERDVVERLAAADARIVSFSQRLKVAFANAIDTVLPGFDLLVAAAKLMVGEFKRSLGLVENFAQGVLSGLDPVEAARDAAQIALMQRQLQRSQIRNEAEARQKFIDALKNQPQMQPLAEGAAAGVQRQGVDILQRIGGVRGGNNDMRRRLELLQRQVGLNDQQLRELKRIARNTDILT